MDKPMSLGWCPEDHDNITKRALRYITIPQQLKDELLIGTLLPDKLLPTGCFNHYQSPDGKFGNAINSIIQNYNQPNSIRFGEGLHYLQDICNPFHTVVGYEVMHLYYEKYAHNVSLQFRQGKETPVFDVGLFLGLQRLVCQSNGYFQTLVDDIINQDFVNMKEVTIYCKRVATEATYELIKMRISKSKLVE